MGTEMSWQDDTMTMEMVGWSRLPYDAWLLGVTKMTGGRSCTYFFS